MADYKRRIKSDNQNAQDVVGANYVLVDGSAALVTVVPTTTGCRLLRVINNTKGLSLNIRSGSSRSRDYRHHLGRRSLPLRCILRQRHPNRCSWFGRQRYSSLFHLEKQAREFNSCQSGVFPIVVDKYT
jgi:hypothetical protein